jgi:putative SOS response-associated peptidase YedK
VVERYSLGVQASQIASYFGVDPYGFEKPRYNAAPSQLLPVITMGSKGLSHFYWGTMPQWSKNKSISEKIINLRSELIADRPTMRKSLAKYRCLVPADGFYGWKKVGKKTSIPYRFQLMDKSLFGMAGTWEEFDDETGEVHHTFSLITLPAQPPVDAVCERMPVILTKEGGQRWLAESTSMDEIFNLLQPNPDLKLDGYTVSPRINQIGFDEASLTFPTPPTDQFGNLTLFS